MSISKEVRIKMSDEPTNAKDYNHVKGPDVLLLHICGSCNLMFLEYEGILDEYGNWDGGCAHCRIFQY